MIITATIITTRTIKITKIIILTVMTKITRRQTTALLHLM